MTTMQPNTRYNHIFKNQNEGAGSVDIKPAKAKKVVAEDSKKFSKELATLNFGIASRDRDVQQRLEQRKDYEDRVAKQGKVVRVAKLADMFTMIDDEIETTLKKTSWKRLSDSYKWKFIKEYVGGIETLDKAAKKKVLSGLKHTYLELGNVEYNMAETRVVRLKATVDGHDV